MEYAPSLEEAIHRYQGSASANKRLGVTKDEIATVDILIKENGIERIHSSYKDSDSFNHDTVIIHAVSKLEQHVQQDQQKQERTGEGFKMRGFSREYIEKIKEPQCQVFPRKYHFSRRPKLLHLHSGFRF